MRLWYFSASVTPSSNMHAQPSSVARCLIFGQTLCLLPYFMYANNEGSGETVWMRRLTRAFAGRLCDNYHNLMSWLNYFLPRPTGATSARVPKDRFSHAMAQIMLCTPGAVIPDSMFSSLHILFLPVVKQCYVQFKRFYFHLKTSTAFFLWNESIMVLLKGQLSHLNIIRRSGWGLTISY